MAALSPLSLLPGPVNNERTWGAPQDLRVGLALDGLSPPSQHSPSPSPISVQEGWRPGRGKWRWRGADTPRGALYPLAAASGAAAPDLRILHPHPRPRVPEIIGPETWWGVPAGGRGGPLSRAGVTRPTGWGCSRPRPHRVGTAGRLTEVGALSPAVRPPSAPLSRHPRGQRFVPHPAQPLPGLVLRRGGRTPLCNSVRTQGREDPSEEVREEGRPTTRPRAWKGKWGCSGRGR